jgi:DNA-binding MarR family transcriptional regulator
MVDAKNFQVAEASLVLADFLPYRFSILSERLSRAFGERYGRAFGLSVPEWRVMAVLGERTQCSTKEVIVQTEMDRVKVSRAVTRLVDMALVNQTPLPEDQRAHMLSLTQRGLGIYHQIIPIAHKLQAEFVAVLDPQEMRALETILTKLNSSAGRLIPDQKKSDSPADIVSS